jgi:hypothetical protein
MISICKVIQFIANLQNVSCLKSTFISGMSLLSRNCGIFKVESTPRSQNRKNATNSPKHQISQKADSQ